MFVLIHFKVLINDNETVLNCTNCNETLNGFIITFLLVQHTNIIRKIKSALTLKFKNFNDY